MESLDYPAAEGGTTVACVMVTTPKTLPVDATVGQVRGVFEDDHVVMVLLTVDGILSGTLLREDVSSGARDSAPAGPMARTSGRTIAPTDSAATAYRRLLESGERRLAVVDGDGLLLGLVCLSRRRTGFCSDAGVRSRAVANRKGTGTVCGQ